MCVCVLLLLLLSLFAPGIVRSIGNVLNDGDSERGAAKGFDLAVLGKLSSTKSNLKVRVRVCVCVCACACVRVRVHGLVFAHARYITIRGNLKSDLSLADVNG